MAQYFPIVTGAFLLLAINAGPFMFVPYPISVHFPIIDSGCTKTSFSRNSFISSEVRVTKGAAMKPTLVDEYPLCLTLWKGDQFC